MSNRSDLTSRLAGALTVVALASCAPTKLLTATTDYSTMMASATAELSAAPGIVTDVCRLRAEIEYLTKRVEPGQQTTTFDAFYTSTTYPINLPGAPTITWRQQCLAYHVADDAFAKAVQSLGDYGAALGAFAADTTAPGEDLQAIAKSAADTTARISATARPYQSALENIGAPLADIANAAATEWKAKELKKLVDRTDKPLQDVTSKLEAFVEVLRTQQIRDVRDALATLLEEMKIRGVSEQKLDVVSAAMIDIATTDRLAQIDRQLAALSDLLHKLADAHAKLKDGWDHGEDVGLDTVKTMGAFAKDIYADLKAFENPTKDGGS